MLLNFIKKNIEIIKIIYIRHRYTGLLYRKILHLKIKFSLIIIGYSEFLFNPCIYSNSHYDNKFATIFLNCGFVHDFAILYSLFLCLNKIKKLVS